jgi:hypothetical protein
MPLQSLQEIIIAYAQYLYEEGRFRAHDSSIEYPYDGPAFAFKRNDDHFEMIDNTAKTVKLPNGEEVVVSIKHRFFGKPKSNQVKAAFGRFQYWENKIHKVRRDPRTRYPDTLQRELEIITHKLLPLAIEILKSAAASYSMLEVDPEAGRNHWTHPPCDLRCAVGKLESGESVPADIQVRVEEFNDLLWETEREINDIREAEFAHAKPWAGEPRASAKCFEACGQKGTTDPSPCESANREQTGNSTIQRMQQSGSPETSEASCGHSGSEPDRQNGQTKSRKARPKNDPCAAERRNAVEAYIAEVLEKTGIQITRTDIWKAARYKTRTEFERWQCNHPKATKTAHERFARLLKEKPHLK